MSPVVQVILTSSLTFGIPLILAVRELWLLRRPDRGTWRPEEPESRPVPRPPGGMPRSQKLPDCLVPKLAPRTPERRRVLEGV